MAFSWMLFGKDVIYGIPTEVVAEIIRIL